MSLHWKMRTNFPFSRVFVLGIILSLLGLVSMIMSIVAFVTQSWGHYAGTGMWGGSMILACGLTAVFVSQLRSLASVKTFCVFSFIAMFTSLIMLILSAGGLNLNSGFYSEIGLAEYNKRASVLIHASLLVNSLFCLSGSILAVIVCCRYLVFEHHDKSKCEHQNRNTLFGTIRTPSNVRSGLLNSSNARSTTTRTPLNASTPSRRHSDNAGNRVQIEYWRCHKHSTTSDQPQTNSHVRRQRHSHADARSNNTNLLSPCGAHDKRVGNNRTSSQGREMRGDNKESERLNIIPLTQVSSRPFSQVQIQPRLPRNPVTTSPLIHLPTEFNEEELPPYEAVQTASNVITGSQSDSGDESDTENSSSTDAQSYNATNPGEEEASTAPLLEIQNSHVPETQYRSEQHKTTNCVSLCEHHSNITSSPKVPDDDNTSEKQTHPLPSSNDNKKDITNQASCTEGAAAVIMRKASRRPNRLVLSYVHTQPLFSKENQRQLSVSPKLCAVKGDSIESAQKKNVRVPRLVQENFYENGPSYENIRCAGVNVNTTFMNHLSKPSSSAKGSTNATSSSKREKETQVKSSVSGKRTPTNGGSSPVSNTSPQLQQSSFGSTISAFRPVCAPSTISPHGSCSSSPLLHINEDGPSLQNSNVKNDKETQDSSSQIYVNTASPKRNPDSSSKPTSKYIEQGAIPKGAKHNGDINISWKNIQPLSYNHFESASNESEKKLPSKMIPFTDSKLEVSSTSLKKVAPTKTKLSSKPSSQSKNLVSSTVPSSSVLTLKSLALPVSLFGAGAEASVALPAKLNNNVNSEAAGVHHQHVSTSSAAVLSNIPVSLVREASTQVNSISTSRWHPRRMGGNQTLLQNRQEELQNSQQRPGETSTRPIRPSSMSGGFSVICHGISGLAADRQSRNRSSEASSTNSAQVDSTNPQPLNSYLANHAAQQPQSLALRQNHLLQHYPLQPQQPRLGVQLHQRRQQQHQLQQNIESQQQHQLQQQLQQPQPANQPNVQGRNGRPLFSVLL